MKEIDAPGLSPRLRLKTRDKNGAGDCNEVAVIIGRLSVKKRREQNE
jgi:hypothetical protein